MRDILEEIGIMLRPLVARVANTVALGILRRVNDATPLQTAQLEGVLDQPVDDAIRYQEFGFYSVPLTGAQAVTIFPNGDLGRPLVVATDDPRYRPRGGEPGEVGLYNSTGARVRLLPSGRVIVVAHTGETVQLGGSGQAYVRGTAYRAAEDTMLTLLQTAFGALSLEGTLSGSVQYGAAASGIATFKAAAATYLSTKVTGD